MEGGNPTQIRHGYRMVVGPCRMADGPCARSPATQVALHRGQGWPRFYCRQLSGQEQLSVLTQPTQITNKYGQLIQTRAPIQQTVRFCVFVNAEPICYIGLDPDRPCGAQCNSCFVFCLFVVTLDLLCDVLDIKIWMHHASLWMHMCAYGCMMEAYENLQMLCRMHMDDMTVPLKSNSLYNEYECFLCFLYALVPPSSTYSCSLATGIFVAL